MISINNRLIYSFSLPPPASSTSPLFSMFFKLNVGLIGTHLLRCSFPEFRVWYFIFLSGNIMPETLLPFVSKTSFPIPDSPGDLLP